MRAFIAIEPPSSLAEGLDELVRQLRLTVDARYVPAANRHLTLAFLGEVGEQGVVRAMDALEAACAACEAPTILPGGLGMFGKARNATLWVGMRGEGLDALAGAVRAELDARGVPFERRAFVGHVTLARHASLREGPLGDLAFPDAFTAEVVTLFRSVLDPSGARYKPLHRVWL